MRNDVVISMSVLIGLVTTIYFEKPIIDSIFALLISIWIMKSGFDIFMETNVELMDGVNDQSVYNKIFETVDTVEGASNPHRLRVRKLANMYVIGIDIEVDPELKIGEAHEIAITLENCLKDNLGNVYDVMVHVEPRGNYEADELYGISSKDIETN
jgi:cation diffusion facilitator family transporter